MMFSVIIPHGGPWDPARQMALEHVLLWWRSLGFDVWTGGGGAPWSKGEAVGQLLRGVSTPGVIVADGDVLVPDDAIARCTAAVAGGAAWAQPHGIVYRLSRRATLAVQSDALGEVRAMPQRVLARPPHQGPHGGGIVILPTETARAVPLDPRFRGFGGDDISWARALDLLAGPCHRLDAPMWHLHHERTPRRPGNRGSEANEALAARYAEAQDDPDAMRLIIREVTDARGDPVPR